jgi:hypothetical protein
MAQNADLVEAVTVTVTEKENQPKGGGSRRQQRWKINPKEVFRRGRKQQSK